MANKFQMYLLQIWIEMSLLGLICCNNVSIQEVKSHGIEKQFQKLITLEKGGFKLELKSNLIEDTLNGMGSYGTPVVKEQKLVFYSNGIELKSHSFPIRRVMKSTKSAKELEVSVLPVFDICLITVGNGNQLYYAYGADFCNGVGCPEFTGLYDMDGSIIYEGISTNKSAVIELKAILKKYKLDINKPDTCRTIFDVWNK